MAMNSNQESPQGVGGWLAFLIAGMLVIGPLLSALRLAGEFTITEAEYPILLTSSDWASFKLAEWLTLLFFCAISIYGGVGLWKKRTPDVVANAKLVLWFNAPISVVATNIIIPAMMMPMAKDNFVKVIPALLASLIVAGIWTAYLNRSKRVRNTYGEVSSALKKNEQTTTNELPAISNPAITSGRAQSARTQEQLWADALTEFESASRRPGLSAKSFAEASGNDAMAKANYLRCRVEELELEAKSQSDEVRPKKTAPATAIAGSSNVIPVNVDAIAEVQISFANKYAWVFTLLVASSFVIFFALNKANPTTKPVAGVGALAVADSSAVAAQQVKPKPINMETFQWQKARDAGFSDDQILNGLNKEGALPFNYLAARKAGYTATEMIDSFIQPKMPNEGAPTASDRVRVIPQVPETDLAVLKQEAEAQKLQIQMAQTARDAQAISDAQMVLKLEFPKWIEDVKSRNFTTWIENEPLEIQALMNSKSVEDVRSLMKRFYGRNKK